MAKERSSNPSPVQHRAKQTVQTVIDATNAAMQQGGESAVRIQEISLKTGVSVGSIYHHFGDRDGLVRATYAHNFSKIIRQDIEAASFWMSGITNVDEMATRFEDMMSFTKDHFKSQPAIERVAIVGNIAGRPELQRSLAEVQHELTNNVTRIFKDAKEKGLLKAGIEPRAGASVLLGMLFGKIISELDLHPIPEDDWVHAMLTCFWGMFNTPVAASLIV